MLYLNKKLVLDNDGYHGVDYKKANFALKIGNYTIKIICFEANDGECIEFNVETPNQGSKYELENLNSY